jgi:hypothetical protein
MALTADTITAGATVFSDVLIAFSVAARQCKIAGEQTSKAATAIMASTYQGVNTQLQDIDLLFVHNPELRPYFYDDKPPPANWLDYQRVMAVAELLVDFMDNVVTQSHAMPDDHAKVWYEYFQCQYKSSPAIQEYWDKNHGWYQSKLQEVLERVSPSRPRAA